jgi:hypothetical protein
MQIAQPALSSRAALVVNTGLLVARCLGLAHALADHGARVAPNVRKQHLSVVLRVALTIAMFP